MFNIVDFKCEQILCTAFTFKIILFSVFHSFCLILIQKGLKWGRIWFKLLPPNADFICGFLQSIICFSPFCVQMMQNKWKNSKKHILASQHSVPFAGPNIQQTRHSFKLIATFFGIAKQPFIFGKSSKLIKKIFFKKHLQPIRIHEPM